MDTLKKPLKLFGLKLKNEQKLMESQSGGAFYAIASYFISKGAIVYGCGMDESNDAVYKRIVSCEELIQIQGSKYVQAQIKHVYPLVKKDLDLGKIVLFSGTPCYTNAVKNYFVNHNNSMNLYTVDLVCHGVPSPKVYHEYLRSLEQHKNCKILKFIFRDKTVKGGGKNTWKK